uniref:Uncharacterized protein n=1 Tax=Graphocephala atropunctata TaxID=36148 RepID=A0A1B6MGX1_9HEMI
MGGDLNLALAYGALGASSGWALMQCTDLMYARVAFGVYLATGIVGVVDYFTSRSKVKEMLTAIARWSMTLYLPLIAAEAILYAGYETIYAYCHLVLPILYLVLTELLKKNLRRDLLELAIVVSAVSLCFSAIISEDVFGGLCVLVNLMAFFSVNYNSREYFLLIAIAQIAAVQFFKHLI